jgi:hypothetical protein
MTATKATRVLTKLAAAAGVLAISAAVLVASRAT